MVENFWAELKSFDAEFGAKSQTITLNVGLLNDLPQPGRPPQSPELVYKLRRQTNAQTANASGI